MAAFSEERLDVGMDYGAQGGPTFVTDIVVYGTGREARNAVDDAGAGSWELGERRILSARKDYLLAFFRARRGRFQGFRFKDWSDYLSSDEALYPDGTPTLVLAKTYASGADAQVRAITKPVAATVALELDGAPYGASLDPTTGVVSLSAIWSAAIESIDATAPAEVTVTGHGRASGEVLYVTGTGTGIDELAHEVTRLDADRLRLTGTDISADTVAFDEPTIARYLQPGAALTWSGEFDVPARFDTDRFIARFDAADEHGEAAYFLASLALVEDR